MCSRQAVCQVRYRNGLASSDYMQALVYTHFILTTLLSKSIAAPVLSRKRSSSRKRVPCTKITQLNKHWTKIWVKIGLLELVNKTEMGYVYLREPQNRKSPVLICV